MRRWEQGRSTIERLLKEQRLQRVTASRDHAEKMLAQARRYASSARKLVSTDPDGAYVLAYDAARKALTAVLENQGLRPTSRGGHVVVIDAVTAQLDPPLGQILRPVDRMRSRRNRVEYPDVNVPEVTQQEVAETLPKVDAVLDTAAKVIDAMPVWS
ncbi:HEPN domain-containing protein [Actinopolymorpha alba]|uniref:HEPN domain-containing protein n=1 Tax=Actinopolymorpha alba TaxID=533267 RepID=UPI00035D9B3B|nr:HEPN domain-containing protein [Actinopolymorpha alba]